VYVFVSRICVNFVNVRQRLFLKKAEIICKRRNQSISQYLVFLLLESEDLVDSELSFFKDKSDVELLQELADAKVSLQK
jgi:hypothetical protein